MVRNIVLAMAYRGEPLRRVFCVRSKALIYLANPERLGAVENGASSPVGFPARDVFEFDEALYARLREQWKANGTTDGTLWRSAKPYRTDLSCLGKVCDT